MATEAPTPRPGDNIYNQDWQPVTGISGGNNAYYTRDPKTGQWVYNPFGTGGGGGGGIPWGSIAKQVIPQVVGAGVGLYNANKQQQIARDLQKRQQPLIDAQAGLVKTLAPYASDFYSRAKSAYDTSAGYYNSLASGDRNRILSTLAPQLRTITDKYNNVLSASRELNPRSGAGASYNLDLAFRAGDEQQALISGERSKAYGKLGELAGTAGSLGASAAGYGSSAASGANNLMISQYNVGQNAAAAQAQSYQDIARALESAWNAYSSRSGGGGTGSGGTGSGGSEVWW